MSVKSMLKAGIANEQAQLQKATTKVDKSEAPAQVVKKEPTKKASAKKTTVKEEKVETPPKNKGGRPTNKERGLKSRKQYTLTLKEDDYRTFLEKASEEDISFAKFMERAAFEYIENHK